MTEGVVRGIDDAEQIVYAAENMVPTPEVREQVQSALQGGLGRWGHTYD
jgi:hypothetical protein